MEAGNGKGELVRHLTFRDLFFLSFGGMSPLLSILTYGAFAYTLAGYDAPTGHMVKRRVWKVKDSLGQDKGK